MKKIQTIYKLTDSVNIVHNEEYPEHYSLTEFNEPCSGIIKHWGTKEALIAELEWIVKKLKQIK
jgi:hypothetical protein